MGSFGRILALALVTAVIAYSSAHKCTLTGRYGPYEGDFTREMRVMQRQVLRRHNHYRRLHGVPILRLNKKLSRIAQGWAQHLADAKDLKHLDREYGENLYAGTSGASNGKEIVDYWYSEICKYDYNNPKIDDSTGHFTHIVWKSGRLLGVGFAKGSDGMDYVACFYKPKQIPEYASTNVLRPINGIPRKCRDMAHK
ncbi:Golgi-associated plant pathogenesis-related protein 1-like [Dermacentor andersoni]|uniref:Golgi-associated plant pathogenesis-related protein 1-like n=1 Tax=Dermacentor andersoni TaxID=34620 RepID=UPI00241695DE|nr:Golgi-associated plant pathogenesis-related protein 1-like [Dermacentor andersoni]XP_054922393.1 Golgi-associated plant pathogenesis-related protein 1-like [Dermacentor andersoni]XP_054922394.1 Golgi-associated plant pathogenesis-related protein 1-like [Dermacentor andersoni]